ncbi:unnamed protein product [Symbiodinium natans]|uniref:Uncharacterized protein n=1 Tax=Symbiodinium natans TaxID=878477 RepID=A0A812IC88_9DINO|nr:unnamed protein product [Symbiodinium natans]
MVGDSGSWLPKYSRKLLRQLADEVMEAGAFNLDDKEVNQLIATSLSSEAISSISSLQKPARWLQDRLEKSAQQFLKKLATKLLQDSVEILNGAIASLDLEKLRSDPTSTASQSRSLVKYLDYLGCLDGEKLDEPAKWLPRVLDKLAVAGKKPLQPLWKAMVSNMPEDIAKYLERCSMESFLPIFQRIYLLSSDDELTLEHFPRLLLKCTLLCLEKDGILDSDPGTYRLGTRLLLEPLLNWIVTKPEMLKGLQGAHPFELESTLREMREKVREWATPKLGHHVSSMHADYLDVLLNTIDLSDLLAKGGTASGCLGLKTFAQMLVRLPAHLQGLGPLWGAAKAALCNQDSMQLARTYWRSLQQLQLPEVGPLLQSIVHAHASPEELLASPGHGDGLAMLCGSLLVTCSEQIQRAARTHHFLFDTKILEALMTSAHFLRIQQFMKIEPKWFFAKLRDLVSKDVEQQLKKFHLSQGDLLPLLLLGGQGSVEPLQSTRCHEILRQLVKLYRLDMDKGPQQGKNLQVQVQQVQLQQKMEDWLREPEAKVILLLSMRKKMSSWDVAWEDMQGVIQALDSLDKQVLEMVEKADDSWVKLLGLEQGGAASRSAKLLCLAKRRTELKQALELADPCLSWARFRDRLAQSSLSPAALRKADANRLVQQFQHLSRGRVR